MTLILLTKLSGQTSNKFCYTKEELQEIAVGLIERNEYRALSELRQAKIDTMNYLLKNKDKVIETQADIIGHKDAQIELYGKQVESLNNDTKALKKEIRRQKVLKWIALIAGGSTTAGALYLYFIK